MLTVTPFKSISGVLESSHMPLQLEDPPLKPVTSKLLTLKSRTATILIPKTPMYQTSAKASSPRCSNGTHVTGPQFLNSYKMISSQLPLFLSLCRCLLSPVLPTPTSWNSMHSNPWSKNNPVKQNPAQSNTQAITTRNKLTEDFPESLLAEPSSEPTAQTKYKTSKSSERPPLQG